MASRPQELANASTKNPSFPRLPSSELLSRALLQFFLLLSRTRCLRSACSEGHFLLVLFLPIAQATGLKRNEKHISREGIKATTKEQFMIRFHKVCHIANIGQNKHQKGGSYKRIPFSVSQLFLLGIFLYPLFQPSPFLISPLS